MKDRFNKNNLSEVPQSGAKKDYIPPDFEEESLFETLPRFVGTANWNSALRQRSNFHE